MFVEELKSGRWRGGYRVGGRNGSKITRTHDYEYEAIAWASLNEGRARAGLDHPVDLDGRSELAAQESAPAPAPVALAVPVAVAAPVTPVTPTVNAYGAEWIEARRGGLEPATISGYRTHLRAIKADPIGRIRLGDLRRSEVAAWQTRQLDAGVGRPTVNARLKVLRMVLRWAVADRVIDHDPSAPVAFLATESTGDRVLTDVEEARLLAACTTPEARAMVLLGLDAGLRGQEVRGLPINAIVPPDAEGRAYVVVRQVIDRTNAVRGYAKGKGHDDEPGRVVPVTPRLLAALVAVRGDRVGSGLMFTTSTGAPLDYFNWRRDVWRPATAAAGLTRGATRVRFHDLRHTYGTRLSAAGVQRREIAELMGHADEATTARYIHAGIDGRRHALVIAALAG